MISLIMTAWLAVATVAISRGPNLVAVASREPTFAARRMNWQDAGQTGR